MIKKKEKEKQEQATEKIVVIFKEPGKNPEYRKIENSDEEFKRILGGEISKLDMVESYIVYLKDSERLKANVYVRAGTNSLGITIKGNLLLVSKEKDSDKIISLTRENAISFGTFLVQRSYDYSNQDENGKFLSKRQMRQREIERLKEKKAELERCMRERMKCTSETNENSKIQINNEDTSNLSPDNKSNSKIEEDDKYYKIDLSPEKDTTPENERKRIYIDTDVVNCLRAMTYMLSEICHDIHKMV